MCVNTGADGADERHLRAGSARSRGTSAFLSQSGGLGIELMSRAGDLGIGISTFVSIGNKADVSGNDLLQYWADDPQTDVILLYLESFGNPREVRAAAPQHRPHETDRRGEERATSAG